MDMFRRSWVIAVGVTLVLGTAMGCGRNASPPGRQGTDEPGPPVWAEPECPAPRPLQTEDRGGIPDGFVTAWVLRCRTEIREAPGKPGEIVRITERADTSAADLVHLLRRPSDPPSNGPCPLVAVFPPYFLLVDTDGRAILPAVPTNGCGQPRDDILDTLDALPFHTVSETLEHTTQSQLSAETGCSDTWKDMIALDADHARPAPARPLWSEPVESILVCVYDRISGSTLPVGRLDTGQEVTGAPAAALRDALDAAGPAADCSTPHTRFAVLTPEGLADWAMAELDGCQRVRRPDGTLGQLTTELIPTR